MIETSDPMPSASESPGEGASGAADRAQQLRLLEALLFAAAQPLDEAALAERLPEEADIGELLAEMARHYAHRGVQLVRAGKGWAFRTAPDLAPLLRLEAKVPRKLSQATVETLAIIAYHQPVTRAEIEEIRAKSLSRGTLEALLEAGWIKPKGRRRTPGRPMTWGTTDAFLDQFGLESLDQLPGLDELKAAGLLDSRPAITAYGALMQETEEAGGEEEADRIAEDAGGEDAGDSDAAAEPSQED